MTDQPPPGEYRPGNCSPLTIWLEPPGGPNIHVGMASSPTWTDRIIRGLTLLAAAEASQSTTTPHHCELPDLIQMGNPVSYPHGMTWTCPACGTQSTLIREGPLAMPTWRRT